MTHLGVLWDRPTLLDECEGLVERIAALVDEDEQLDLIGGSAGAILSLLTLHRFRPASRTLAVATACGDRLLDRARRMECGIGWIGPIESSGPLAGCAHGAAGVAWALLDLAAASAESRFRAAALDAIAYERTLFVPEAGNWRDLRTREMRDDGREPPFSNAWCYGAPGIGIARLRSLRHVDDPVVRAEVDVALRTTLAGGALWRHTLCHGHLGNLDLVSLAADTFDDECLRDQRTRATATVVDRIEREGWRCATPLGIESPGLMNGLAGIGYGLLRLAEPARVPSILGLEPPNADGRSFA
jgi:lantibiotic modifying enzyme